MDAYLIQVKCFNIHFVTIWTIVVPVICIGWNLIERDARFGVTSLSPNTIHCFVHRFVGSISTAVRMA